MSRLVPIAALALAWIALTGSLSFMNVVFGLALATVAQELVRPDRPGPIVRLRPLKTARLVAFFLKQLILSAWRVARIVTRPKLDIAPGILAFPLTVERDVEIALLANMITLTPGTLSVDVSPDRRTLFVHAIDCSDPDGARREIAEGFERKVQEALR